jgi:uncharacterized protein (DUF1015 family)
MADIEQFRGYRYRLDKPGDLGDVASPPYDMVDAGMVERLYARSPYNVVRIVQNRPHDSDTTNSDRHHRAAGLFASWIDEGRIVRDEVPSAYVYRQSFAVQEAGGPVTRERTAVVVLVKLVDYADGIVQPHEYTLTGPKKDRLELLEAIRCNTGLIFGLVPDDGELYRAVRSAGGRSAQGTFRDENGVLHELHVNSDRKSFEGLRSLMAGRPILIADGHHRYETALAYARRTGREADGYVMMALVSMADPGLVIRPFHRLVKSNETSAKFRSVGQLSRFFDVTRLGAGSAERIMEFLAAPSESEMLYLDASSRQLYGLSIARGGEAELARHGEGRSALWNSLSVSKINICCVQGLMEQPLDGGVLHEVLDFVNDAGDAYRRVTASDGYVGAFFIRPIDIATVRAIVSAGERMPQKSTNFYPKVYSGLVFHRLADT